MKYRPASPPSRREELPDCRQLGYDKVIDPRKRRKALLRGSCSQEAAAPERTPWRSGPALLLGDSNDMTLTGIFRLRQRREDLFY
ncbi:hypothetical protein [Steroidobacter denitrificans]|nr:hypothetical protein [Steroidobacter denitrificans]